jgi:hypothetical protein
VYSSTTARLIQRWLSNSEIPLLPVQPSAPVYQLNDGRRRPFSFIREYAVLLLTMPWEATVFRLHTLPRSHCL